ncbi:MAG: hypothetical protein WD766_05355, partial [Gemmatimonadota bacterium]
GRVRGAGRGVLGAAATPDQELAAEADAERDGTEEEAPVGSAPKAPTLTLATPTSTPKLSADNGPVAGASAEPAMGAVAGAAGPSRPVAAVVAGAAVAAGAEVAGSVAESAEAVPVEEAAVEAAAVTEASSTIDVRRVDRNLEKLQPEFRERLDRVIERMESEFGHSVTVVEGHRSQTRQNFLYEQGRSRPGNVVTWTRNSNHTVGRAADVMIDGTYNNALGYQRLATIAAEEGLQTLGPKDPGHIELPRDVPGGLSAPQYAGAAVEGAASPDLPRAPSRVGGLARVAEVARVAELVQVARVADLAEVAQVARVADPTRPAAPVQTPAPAEISAAVFAARAGQSNPDGQGASGGRREQQAERIVASAEMELLRTDPGLTRSFAGNSIVEPQMTSGTDAVQRAAQILAMKEGSSAAPINHLLLRLDSPGGGEDRIRVDLRGNTVGTTLNIENRADAEQLSSKVGELRQSLERHGLEADAVRIRTTPALSAERVDIGRAAISAAELEAGRNGGNSRSGADSQAARDGWTEAEEQQQRRDSSDARNRSRKEQSKEGAA